jgi:predicted DNA-binding transcriptional regulator YafY
MTYLVRKNCRTICEQDELALLPILEAWMTNLNLNRQQRRIVIIDQELRSRHRATLKTIAAAVKAAGLPHERRTIQRDMDHMRDDLRAPIEWRVTNPDLCDGVREYYYVYTNPQWQLGDILVEKDDLLAMTLARELLRHTVGAPGADALSKTYDKLLGLADDNVRKATNLMAPIAFAGGMSAAVSPDVWNTVLKAIREKKTLRITYGSGWRKAKKPSRVIDPYYIVNLAGDWYMIGTAGLDDPAIRQYKMARITSPIISQASFKMPADFNIDKYLENVFGRFVGDPKTLVNIKVQFKKRVAPLIVDQQFHRQEKRTRKKNGDIVVGLPVTSAGPWPFYHVISWILSWGADATVLAPQALKKLVEDECRKMAANLR